MNIYLDCEFNGHKGQLLSMAMITDKNHAFYEVVEHDPSTLDPWVRDNVLPHLIKEPISYENFRLKFRQFLLQYDNPHICVDYHADLLYFFELLNGNTYETDLFYPCTTEIGRIEELESDVPHSAYYDALALRKQWPTAVKLNTDYHQTLDDYLTAIRMSNDHAAFGILESIILKAVSVSFKQQRVKHWQVPLDAHIDLVKENWNED